MEVDIFVHPHPVWRDSADFIIGAWLPDEQRVTHRKYEQLWARRVSDNVFEICCIPCFANEIALGDEVETAPQLGKSYSVTRIIKRSGHLGFQVWFENVDNLVTKQGLITKLEQIGCVYEWYSPNTLGVSAPSTTEAEYLAKHLQDLETLGHINYQTIFAGR